MRCATAQPLAPARRSPPSPYFTAWSYRYARSGDGEPVIRFRNYEPTSEDLASLPKVEQVVIPDVEEQVGTVRSRSQKAGLVPPPH